MMDVKINGNTYNDVERVCLTRADGQGTYSLVDGTFWDAFIENATMEDEYYNSIITKIGIQWPIKKVTKINFPNVTTAACNAFYNMNIAEARLPSFTTSNNGLFISCAKLEKVIFGSSLAKLGQQDFRGCSALKTLVLPYDGIVSITVATNGTSTFQDSGVAAGTGYVYVPASQVDAYKADTNWSTYANQIRAIEDYPEETA